MLVTDDIDFCVFIRENKIETSSKGNNYNLQWIQSKFYIDLRQQKLAPF